LRFKGEIMQVYEQTLFFNMKKDSLYIKMLSDKRITHGDKAVWAAFASFLRPGNWVVVDQKTVAQRLGCSTRTLTKSISALIERGYLQRGDVRCEYRIPKEMAFFQAKGDAQ